MHRIRIGICLGSLGLPLRRGLRAAERLGVAGVQLDAAGDLAPNNLSQTGRQELRHLLRSCNLQTTAVGCPLRQGLAVVENQDARIDHVRKVLTLSCDLGARLVVLQAGRVPADPASPEAHRLGEALLALGQYGDRIGATLALETGLEAGASLAEFLRRFDTGSLRVNLDPANLVMNGLDPYRSTRDLAGLIAHVHAKDARSATASRAAQEVPLGHGDLDWIRFVSLLEEAEYRGWMVIERDSGEDRLTDVSAGVGFLRRLVGPGQP